MIHDAGELNRKVSIYNQTASKNNDFDATKNNLLYKNVWAQIKQVRGREYYEAQVKSAEGNVVITIRYRRNINEGCYVTYKQHLYNIQSVVNPDMANESLELYCVEQKRGTKPSAGGWEP